MQIVFEGHRTTLDNERGVAAARLPGRLPPTGRRQAARLACGRNRLPVPADRRLRECDDGRLNGTSAQDIRAARAAHLATPYPGGERRRQAVARVRPFIRSVVNRWPDGRVLVIGHAATRRALRHRLLGTPLEGLAARVDAAWQPVRPYEATEVDMR